MSDLEAKKKPEAPAPSQTDVTAMLMGLIEKLSNNPANDLALEELRERRETRQKQDHETRELARKNAEEAAKGMAITKRNQDNCLHRMESGKTRLAGQILDNGKMCLICLACQKVWHDGIAETDGAVLNEQLYPGGERVGYGARF